MKRTTISGKEKKKGKRGEDFARRGTSFPLVRGLEELQREQLPFHHRPGKNGETKRHDI